MVLGGEPAWPTFGIDTLPENACRQGGQELSPKILRKNSGRTDCQSCVPNIIFAESAPLQDAFGATNAEPMEIRSIESGILLNIRGIRSQSRIAPVIHQCYYDSSGSVADVDVKAHRQDPFFSMK
jgi:hypothetical protein